MTIRLSAISFAGTARTLVAVGTVSEASMFFAMAAAAPRSCFDSGSSFFASAFGSALAAGFGAAFGSGFGAVFVAAFGSGFAGAACLAADSALRTTLADGCAAWPLVAGLASACCRAVSALACAFCVGLKSAKKSCHAASTEEGSARNWSYISSTSHSLGPNCDAGLLLDTAGARLYPSRSRS